MLNDAIKNYGVYSNQQLKDFIYGLENKYNVHLLEHKYTDVYISPNNDGKSVDLKLLFRGRLYGFFQRGLEYHL